MVVRIKVNSKTLKTKEEEQKATKVKEQEQLQKEKEYQQNLSKIITKNGNSYHWLLPFDQRKAYSNEIKKVLADLVDIYRMHVINGVYNEPFCQVFKSEKFQKNFYNKWRRISNILLKDEKKVSDSDKKILATADLTKLTRQSMDEDLKKLYNL